jgi:hypothetical protein
MIRDKSSPRRRSSDIRHHNKAGGTKELPVIRASVVLLGAIVVTCVGLLVPPLWTAFLKVWQFNPGAQECSSLKDPTARQTCNQERNVIPLQTPAKGG